MQKMALTIVRETTRRLNDAENESVRIIVDATEPTEKSQKFAGVLVARGLRVDSIDFKYKIRARQGASAQKHAHHHHIFTSKLPSA